MTSPSKCLSLFSLGNARKAFDRIAADLSTVESHEDAHIGAAMIMLADAKSEHNHIVEQIKEQEKSGNFNVDWESFNQSLYDVKDKKPFSSIGLMNGTIYKETNNKGESDEQGESEATSKPGDTALAGASTGNDAQTEEGRNTGGDSTGIGTKDAGRTSRADKSRNSARKRMGNGAGDLFDDAGRAGSDAGSGAERSVQGGEGGADGNQRAIARDIGAIDYRITDLTRLGEGGQRTKYNNNVEAIRLMRSLQEEGRTATPGEQNTLARYVGWGGIPQAFDAKNADWSKQHAELNGLLSPEEWDAAIESTQYAHYTSQGVIGGIYKSLEHIGFSGGRILEPGSGVGNFIGLMPDSMRSQSRFTGVEREKIAGGIAKLLYPNQNIQQQDFTYFNAEDGYFDAIIGNPPFSEVGLNDMTGRKHLSGLSVHNYFFAKSVDMLRENGVLAMVVTSSFMDAKKDRARTYIADRAKLLGAIRLPNSAFMGNAGTDVTTDIIFLQKLPESEWGSKATREDAKRWIDVGSVSDPRGGSNIPLNQYFVSNPNMMIGRMERVGGRYRDDMPGLVFDKNASIADELSIRIENLPQNVYVSQAVSRTKAMNESAIEAMQNINAQVGGYFVRNGSLYQRMSDIAGEQMATKITPETQWTEKTLLGEKKHSKLIAATEVRNTLRALIVAESKNLTEMEGLREELNKLYDAFKKEYGYFNDRASIQLLGDDPDFPLLMSLERDYDPGISDAAAKKQGIKAVKPSAKKSDIFSKSILGFREAITKAESPVDALMISIAERGRIDPQFIGELLGRDGTLAMNELASGDNPELFIDPEHNGYVLKDEYLSGNVRKKLKQAKSRGLDVNARALERVIPQDIPSHEIQGKLGAPWIPTSVYQKFIKHLLGDDVSATVVHVEALNVFIADIQGGSDVANTNTYGIPKFTAKDIIKALLNNKEVKVGYTDDDGKWHLLKDKTDEALDKAATIRDKFSDWLMSDPEQSEELTRQYNDKMNNYVSRKYDGSLLSFPGKVFSINMRRHQRNAISRIIRDGRALLDHVVGAGKTFAVIGAAMELKRTGLAKKSMIVVPNHLVKQWGADFYRLYPGANILVATKKDFEKSNRRKFLAKIATGDWDAVVIAHSSFGFIRPDENFEASFNNERIREVVSTIDEMGDTKNADSQTKRTVKQLAKMKERLEQRIKALRDKPMDSLLDFGQLGIDQLFVDEAHLFKNLMYTTKMQNVRGLSDQAGSQRAYDMFVKTHQITSSNGGTRGVVFATGTPVSNSLAEMYHMMRYLMPEALEDMGHKTFDAWANTFADVEQVWMQALSGDGYKSTNRMTKFVNTPELLKTFGQVADTVTIDDIKTAYLEENGKEFPIPKLKGGRRTPVSIPLSQDQKDYMIEIASRAKKLEQSKGKPQKGDDNMLTILGDARKAAMDIRLVNHKITERDPNGRIALVAKNVLDTYQKFNDVRGTQLIFSDMGTPKKHAEKELKIYNELMAIVAIANDPDVIASADLGDESAIEKIQNAEDAQEKIASFGRDWMSAIKSAMNGFSIYDDMRQALIELGIPENEIAFIHDYNTDDQKAALFRAVNDGKIRVLMGSTPKMGAGTNVQDRLVELHHMDVPWKPSDIEQREGRIVRQGNKLLELLGDTFEVSIKAYATQDTLDLFMWQVQEKKLGMINQLRTGQVGREMDDAFEEMQMSAGEMQAAATSNPYLLEEIQLNEQVKRLARKKKSFEGQRNDLINRKNRAEKDVATIPAELMVANALLEADRSYADELSNRKVSLSINGENFDNEEKAAERLRELTANDDDAKADDLVSESEGKKKRKTIDPIDLNGKSYKSKAAVAEAFREIVGDADRISFTRDGEAMIRRKDINKAIQADVMHVAETDDIKEIGALGDYKISISGEHSKSGGIDITVYAEAYGKEHPDAFIAGHYVDVTDAVQKGVPDVVRAMTRLASRMKYIVSDLDYKLSKAKKTLEELKDAGASDVWDGEEELAQARARHREVLKQISTSTGDNASDNNDSTVFSQAGSRVPPEQQLPEEFLLHLVDSELSFLSNPPPVFVHDSFDGGQLSGVGEVPAGGMQGGKLFLFRDGISSAASALATVWHELFHYGIRKLMTPEQYSAQMYKLYNSDSTVRDYSTIWLKSEEAANRQEGGMSITDLHLLSIEEALAKISEKVGAGKDDYSGNRQGEKSIVRKLLVWMADMAKELGMKRIAQALRTMTMTDGERYIASIFKRLASNEVASEQTLSDLDLRSMQFRTEGFGKALQDAAGNTSGLTQKAMYLASDFMDRSGQISWWDKSVGTPYHMAKRNPLFSRVYDRIQSFIGDVSKYTSEAADLAPTMIPKLETLADMKRQPISAVDNKAIAAPIFEGTLSWMRDKSGEAVRIKDSDEISKAGVTFTPKELRQHFGLSDGQISLYEEFRKAADKSITTMAISDMLRVGGKNVRHLTDEVMQSNSVTDAAGILSDYFESTGDEESAKLMIDKGVRAQELMDHGYAPLSRFGKHTVYVEKKGEQVYFGMFEDKKDAAKMAREMRQEYPGATVTHGTQSEEAYKLFSGINPETIELFGDMIGMDSDPATSEVYQSYLKAAKNNRSAMKRLIHRKGIAGFSDDAGRVLANFLYSNGRLTAQNLHMGELDEAANDIPKSQGELKDAAVQLRDHVKNPEGGASKLGGLMFAQYLGGSVASAVVNLTQPIMMTMPYLSQFGGVRYASKELYRAARDAYRDSTGDKDLDAALKLAEDEGIVAPQEAHHIQAQAAGRASLSAGDGTKLGDAKAMANNWMQKGMLAWGQLFSLAEQTNRRVTFIAAYRTAVANKMENPAKFAEEAIAATQGTYNAGNKPKWARTTLGGLAMTFKQYSIAYVELLHRMWNAGEPGSEERKNGRMAALTMIAVLMLMSGADGLPFEQDIEDLIDGVMQRFGYNFGSKREKEELLRNVLGAGGADFVLKGISGLPGMPVDVVGRFGLGNLIPATGLLKEKASYASDLTELAGAPGDFAKRAYTSAGKALSGDIIGAGGEIAPRSVSNVVKGIDMYSSGAYKDGRGYKVNDVTPFESFMKAAGFQPNTTAHIQDAKQQSLDMMSQMRTASAHIQEHWAQGIAKGDSDIVDEARKMRDEWNSKNPESRIQLNMPAISKRAKAMRQDAAQRTVGTAPKSMKAAVRDELQQGVI